MSHTPTPLGGVLAVDKPAGYTSHDVVARVRRLAGLRQVGHAGTLDPMATGLLLLCLGRATRLLEYVSGQEKSYVAGITLGISTNTYDAEGEISAQRPLPELSAEQLDQALAAFRGPIMQRPPAFSALKRDGIPLYQRARAGETVTVDPRPVTVYSLELLDFNPPHLTLQVRCGAGTYVRSLAHDLGEALGCGAHLHSLRRDAIGTFHVADAFTLPQLETMAARAELAAAILPPERAVQHLPRLDADTAATRRLIFGQSIAATAAAEPGPARVYDADGHFMGIAEYDAARRAWRPHKLLTIGDA
ncbi:MAG: tRNA pseudouridine(55) synthase TruB [Caldilineales bacterium]